MRNDKLENIHKKIRHQNDAGFLYYNKILY